MCFEGFSEPVHVGFHMERYSDLVMTYLEAWELDEIYSCCRELQWSASECFQFLG